MIRNLTKFLRESNAIEDVFDKDSLKQARYAWDYLITEDKLTPSVILKTHKILMLHHLVGNQKGYFRTVPVWVGGREGKPWFAVPELIAQWCEKANLLEDPIQDHLDYETIHPFVDGNGRTGRLFMNWQRIKAGDSLIIFENKFKHTDYYPLFQLD